MLSDRFPHLSTLLEALDTHIHLLGSGIKRHERKSHISYAAPRLFLKVKPETDHLLLELIDVAGHLVDPTYLARPAGYADHFRHMEVALTRPEQLDDVMPLVKQACDFAHRKKRQRGDPSTILRCSFPFPEQSPPVEASAACINCPNADRAILDYHALIEQDDPALLEAVRSFATWLVADRPEVDQIVRYGADLYTRANHTGTCVPKTVIFAIHKITQHGGEVRLTKIAQRAFNREPVPCWPTGETRALPGSDLFYSYSRRYD